VTTVEDALDFDDKQDYEVGDGMKLILYEEPFRIQVKPINIPYRKGSAASTLKGSFRRLCMEEVEGWNEITETNGFPLWFLNSKPNDIPRSKIKWFFGGWSF
jgi:hypothetical protein